VTGPRFNFEYGQPGAGFMGHAVAIELNTLLTDAGIPLASTLIMRHTPTERGLLRRLSVWAESNPQMYNDYQSNQDIRQENMLRRAKYLASFIGPKVGEALFVGIYKVEGWKEIPVAEFCEMEIVKELYGYGSRPKQQDHVKWFDLGLMPQMAEFKGRLVLSWPQGAAVRSWARWAEPNTFPVKAIHAESILVPPMPPWREVVCAWAELKTLPDSWRATLRQWRAIYLIHDVSDGKTYVGSAYGEENVDDRWAAYAATGHGGNAELRSRDPRNFRFSILELVGPSMPGVEVIAIEGSWKRRLHTLFPNGLNRN
jgi:hypothetical protein